MVARRAVLYEREDSDARVQKDVVEGNRRRQDETAALEMVAIFGTWRLRLPGRGAGGLNEPNRRRSVTRDAAHSPVGEGTAAPVKCSAQ